MSIARLMKMKFLKILTMVFLRVLSLVSDYDFMNYK